MELERLILSINEIITTIEKDLNRIKVLLKNIQHWENVNPEKIKINSEELVSYQEDWLTIVEWIFDWYFFIWPNDKKLPVPLNYASKSKLIPGDKLKLTIFSDWKLVYKLIKPAQRKHLRATVSKIDDNKYIAITDEWKTYKLNLAAVTYFKLNPWDEISIIVNSDGSWEYAAIEWVINKLSDEV